MDHGKKLPTGRLQRSLKLKLEKWRKLNKDIDDLMELIADMACPFSRGDTITFMRGKKKLTGVVAFIRYRERILWSASVTVKGRVHRIEVRPNMVIQ